MQNVEKYQTFIEIDIKGIPEWGSSWGCVHLRMRRSRTQFVPSTH